MPPWTCTCQEHWSWHSVQQIANRLTSEVDAPFQAQYYSLQDCGSVGSMTIGPTSRSGDMVIENTEGSADETKCPRLVLAPRSTSG